MKKNKKEIDVGFIKKWMKKGFDPILLSILYRRGVVEEEDLFNIFFPLFENIDSPFKFCQIISAYERLSRAVERGEKIIVYGDKDVDGTTSVAIFFDFFKKLGANIDWDVPTGSDGYGLSLDKIEKWKDKQYSLCITLDCGITNIAEVAALKTNGVDCIIIDHHEPLQVVPDCVAIIDPKCEKGFKNDRIAACGVTFLFVLGYLIYNSEIFNKKEAVLYFKENKINVDIFKNLLLIETITIDKISDVDKLGCDKFYYYTEKDKISSYVSNAFKEFEISEFDNSSYDNSFFDVLDSVQLKLRLIYFKNVYANISKRKEIEYIKKNYLPLASIGTVADIMPLTGVNRIIVALGLNYIRNGALNNISGLIERLELDRSSFTSKEISWNISPLLNAPGRMGDATVSVYFLLDKENSGFYLDAICEFNKERKLKEDDAVLIFKKDYEENKAKYDDIGFFYNDTIHKGITGVAAAKLSGLIGSPAIVAAKDGEFYVGSIRGKANFNFVEFLDKGKTIFIEYGGHQAAAGFRFHQTKLNDFIDFLKKSKTEISKYIEKDCIDIDAEIPLEFLNYELFAKINSLEPFGHEFLQPILWSRGIEVYDYNIIGKDKTHLKLFFKTEPNPIIGLFWGQAEWFAKIHNRDNKYDILYQLEFNKYNGQIIPQIMIMDMETS
ncbi:MAG TPA: single-stranded-DNA-specific exonuclease RecJ [Spirochaetota bacterium]|jgi:single-stranded-DNA-specific exonuclease|nr:MAG: Single-stranded-DNA-specific exonuclease RecJ [Spirochaetes bacterium ADurb.Bin133]HNZ27862.1 single-stranded-DNA-specific exonuclease RecJ [Spirochaetota bacterium]HPY88841.1 single-stranded-DNA-specific exonuclease RecJ [Spirochaetota bacterium]